MPSIEELPNYHYGDRHRWKGVGGWPGCNRAGGPFLSKDRRSRPARPGRRLPGGSPGRGNLGRTSRDRQSRGSSRSACGDRSRYGGDFVARARIRAGAAGILGAALGFHFQMQFMGLLVHIQSLVHQFPGRFYAKTQELGAESDCRPSRFLIADFPDTLAQVLGGIPLNTSRSRIHCCSGCRNRSGAGAAGHVPLVVAKGDLHPILDERMAVPVRGRQALRGR